MTTQKKIIDKLVTFLDTTNDDTISVIVSIVSVLYNSNSPIIKPLIKEGALEVNGNNIRLDFEKLDKSLSGLLDTKQSIENLPSYIDIPII